MAWSCFQKAFQFDCLVIHDIRFLCLVTSYSNNIDSMCIAPITYVSREFAVSTTNKMNLDRRSLTMTSSNSSLKFNGTGLNAAKLKLYSTIAGVSWKLTDYKWRTWPLFARLCRFHRLLSNWSLVQLEGKSWGRASLCCDWRCWWRRVPCHQRNWNPRLKTKIIS